MIYKLLISFICIQSFSISLNNEIEKDYFTVFIKSLYSRGMLRKEANTFYVIFNNLENERYFTKKVKYENKSLCMKKTKSLNKADLLKIVSISKSDTNKISIKFSSAHSGVTFEGTIFLGIENNKPIFLDATILKINE